MTPDECAQTLDTLAANARACAEWSDAEALSAGAAALRRGTCLCCREMSPCQDGCACNPAPPEAR